ncbi:GNAT family N-acetyltransferase [Antarctobacter jejuensis]|uniref:GNAT family N-acetyltransferase n=1 Tax=Antarctobacter jejuensis TaxID=1439938 RepID=UPI003FD5665A
MTPEAASDIAARAYRHMTPWRADQIAATLRQPTALLSTSDHAFVLGQVIADEAEILALACDPDFQRQGEAARALDRFHTAAAQREATRVFLEVAARNAPARAFYEARGYTRAGLRKGYYPRPDGTRDDALIMTRALP